MNTPSSLPQLSAFSEFLSEQMGLNFPAERAADLERGLRAAAAEFGHENLESCIEWLMSAPLSRNQIDVLARCFTVGETYFFREKAAFQFLEEQVLPEIVQSRANSGRKLRVWSAGCCTGEEPYSLAITLQRCIPALATWNVSVLGSDINTKFLERAARGVYGEWSFRNVPSGVRERWFRETRPGEWEIAKEIREMTSFAHLNLAEDTYPSVLNNTNAMDIIFCRNVLMYFTHAQARKVIAKLHRCLVEGGWLVLCPVESTHSMCPEFLPVSFEGALFFRKDGAGVVPLSPTPFVRPEMENADADEAPVKPFEENLWFDVPAPMAVPAGVATVPDRYGEALSLYDEGNYAGTVALLETMLNEGGGGAQECILLAHTKANEGKLAEALTWSERAIASDKLDPAAHYLHGTVLSESGDLTAAAAAFTRVLYLDPEFVLAHYALAALARREGRPMEADKHIASLVDIIRDLPEDVVLRDAEGLSAGRLLEIAAGLSPKAAA